MALGTWALAIVGGVTLYFQDAATKDQLAITRDQLAVTREQLREAVEMRQMTVAQVRGKLSHLSPSFFPVGPSGKIMDLPNATISGYHLNPVWKNAGTTDITDFDSSLLLAGFTAQEFRRAGGKSFLDVRAVCPPPTPLPISGFGTTIHGAENKIEAAEMLPIDAAKQIERGELIMLLVQNAVYRDAFQKPGESHHLYECDQVSVNDAYRGKISFPVMREYAVD